MNYFFPSIIPSVHIPEDFENSMDFMVDSGRNALRLLLRSFDLPKKTKVAIPAFVCDTVSQAVTLEDFIPILFDLKNDNTLWTDYNLERIKQENIKAIILVHLYGFIHPDTDTIAQFCRENKLKLIHDTAQSFGIDENVLNYTDGIIYSFGAGKSSTAAGGGLLKGITKDFYNQHVIRHFCFPIKHLQSQLFLKSRIFGYEFSLRDKILKEIVYRFNRPDNRIFALGEFEKNAAKYAMALVRGLSDSRQDRYKYIANRINSHPFLSIAYDDNKGLYFKVVLFVKEERTDAFKNYLQKNNVPYFCLYDSIKHRMIQQELLPNFKKNAYKFIEISCEATIPLNEIKRVAELLSKYQ